MCNLINKYNVAGPRYTSYPTVPYWDINTFSLEKWKSSLKTSFDLSNDGEGISLYIHLPFCESLCTFCGCNKRITKRHEVELPYIDTVLKEWRLYREILVYKPRIKQIHLGGGTPTFFSPENLEKLILGILRYVDIDSNPELSFEGHPNNTTEKHLKVLYNLGFKRVCYGVQDYTDIVQKAIHRIQSFEQVKHVTDIARAIGYTSVAHDIIYGLPFQTEAHIQDTIQKTIQLKPDRIAFYSYAHVPWLKGNGQRGFKDENLPNAEAKRKQYELGKKLLLEAGYHEIGMDHFALESDALHIAYENNTLHRNFMGYSASKTQVMIGLGVSSISDSWNGLSQNVKNLETYEHLVNSNILPISKGHILNAEDMIISKHILNLMCNFKTEWYKTHLYFNQLPNVILSLKEMENDGLVDIKLNEIQITEKGKPFVRNICMAFDLLLQRNKPETKLFSMTV